MDFYQIKEKEVKKGELDVYPDFKVMRSKDLMVRAKQFYAIWDDEKGLWSTDEYDVQRLVDSDIRKYEVQSQGVFEVHRKYLGNFSSNSWLKFRTYIGHLSDNSKELDSNLTFRNTDVKKDDYVTKRLPYDLAPGDVSAWDELVSTLYSPEERAKIEWAIGAIIAGDSKTIQKFLVFYGAPGTGKSTIINIIQLLFEGYWNSFVAADLVGANSNFALEAFKNNPLIAIEHDSDLSRIQDNSKLNSLVAHEPMEINEKNKPKYSMRFNAMIMVGSNKPVKITDSRSGLIRRLIDIRPTGNLLSARKYQTLMSQIKFELGALAWHCREVYLSMGKDYYSGYKPVEMMLQTDIFFNFIEAHYDIFKAQDGVTLNQAFEMYKQFIKESDIEHSLPRHKLRDELKNYFDSFEDRVVVDGERLRSWYSGFNADHFKSPVGQVEDKVFSLVMEETESIFDKLMAKKPAQYAKEDGTPRKKWTVTKEELEKGLTPVDTKLSDLDTSKEHFVKVPEDHIVIDFDLTDENGEKSLERNLEAASKWPPTYGEFSRSGKGVHLHYRWTGGTPEELVRLYDSGIEIKVFTGGSSLRRRLSRCNNIPVADLSTGLPFKEKQVMNQEAVMTEKSLRALIDRNLKKEIHSSTKPSIDFIHKLLEEAYASDLTYDVTDMRQRIAIFAAGSTNQAPAALKMVQSMQFKSADTMELKPDNPETDKIVFFDVEVYPNLFMVCWKYEGSPTVVRMINPSSQEIESLMSLKLVGFNVRRYDNHILYARYMGYSNADLYKLSQKLINNSRDAYFGAAYNISYADIYDFASKKQSLKKWQIELGIKHLELNIPWDQPVPEEMWGLVEEYCVNDVISTEATFEARKEDFIARQILADLSGLPVNSSTQQHTARIVFGEDRNPQSKFNYTNLAEQFEGYTFESGKSTYRGEEIGEGGLVRAKPGIYSNVAVLDIASMHPTSIEELDLFGEYTKNFSALKNARLAIKHGDYDSARKMLGGKLARHLGDEDQAEALSYALKIVINIVYGLTAARFDNAFRDPRNIDNIVAKRGALFMLDLMYAVEEQGFNAVHIKTDSIKIPDATPEIIEFVMEYGEGYGYTFEHEATFDKFCLVNDAVYIAKVRAGRKPAHWEAVGAQFQHPVVFKTLFDTDKSLKFDDFCETKTVTTALYLDFSEDLSNDDTPMALKDGLDDNNMRYVGRAGQFVPVLEGGGTLVREKNGEFHSANGTKGYKWLEAEVVRGTPLAKKIDMTYFDALVNDAIDNISKFGNYNEFVGA